MESARLYNVEGEALGWMELPKVIFGIEPSYSALYQATKVYLTNQRHGSASTKNRALVSGSGAKLYRQKGTGRSRAGSAKSPIRVGGGVAFGPQPHSYRERVPRKVRRLAVKSALSLKLGEGRISVVEDFSPSEPRTKTIVRMLEGMGLGGGQKVLFLADGSSSNLIKSCRNIPGLQLRSVGSFCAYDILDSEVVILMQGALESLKEVLGG